MKHPADRIRAQVLVVLVGLALLGRDLLKIRRWAGDAHDIERELRLRKAREENAAFEIHQERVEQLQAEIARLREPKAEPEP